MIDKIKAEIERRYNDNLKAEETAHTGHFGSAAKEDYDLLSFIESLEKEQDGTLAPDESATNEEVEKMLKERRDKQRYEVLKAVEKKYGSQLNQAWDDALHEGYLDGWKECEAAWKKAQNDLPKIKGWVARDEADRLGLYDQKPTRSKDLSHSWVIGDDWIGRFSLDRTAKTPFPDVTWETEPIEVELTISRVIK